MALPEQPAPRPAPPPATGSGADLTMPLPPPSAGTRWVMLVDVGYLVSAAGDVLHGEATRRALRVDAPGLVAALARRAQAAFGGRMLRVYWVDGARDRVPTVEQRPIATMPGVVLRLGNVNRAGQQKGVDSAVRHELEELSDAGVITDAILVSGDEDMLPAVAHAQARGVRVHLWGVQARLGTNIAEGLAFTVDTQTLLPEDLLAPYVTLRGTVEAPLGPLSRPHPVPASHPAATETPAGPAGVAGATEHAPDAAPPGPAPSGSAPVAEPGRPAADVDTAAAAAPPAPEHAEHGVAEGAPPTPASLHRPRAGTPAAAPRPQTPDERLAAGRRELHRQQAYEAGAWVAGRWEATRGRDFLVDLLPGPTVSAVIDRDLLETAETALGYSLRDDQGAREAVRDGLFDAIRRITAAG